MRFYQYLDYDYKYYALVCANSVEEANDIFEAGMGFANYEPFEINPKLAIDRMKALGVNIEVNNIKPSLMDYGVYKRK